MPIVLSMSTTSPNTVKQPQASVARSPQPPASVHLGKGQPARQAHSRCLCLPYTRSSSHLDLVYPPTYLSHLGTHYLQNVSFRHPSSCYDRSSFETSRPLNGSSTGSRP